MSENDRIAAVREWLRSREGIVGTHYDGCWQYHAGCVASLLMDEIDRLMCTDGQWTQINTDGVARGGGWRINRDGTFTEYGPNEIPAGLPLCIGCRHEPHVAECPVRVDSVLTTNADSIPHQQSHECPCVFREKRE